MNEDVGAERCQPKAGKFPPFLLTNAKLVIPGSDPESSGFCVPCSEAPVIPACPDLSGSARAGAGAGEIKVAALPTGAVSPWQAGQFSQEGRQFIFAGEIFFPG